MLVEMDNRESARAIEAGFSSCPRIMPSIRSIRMLCARSNICLRVRHILGVPFNTIADHLSHNRVLQAVEEASVLFGCEMRPWPNTRSLLWTPV